MIIPGLRIECYVIGNDFGIALDAGKFQASAFVSLVGVIQVVEQQTLFLELIGHSFHNKLSLPCGGKMFGLFFDNNS